MYSLKEHYLYTLPQLLVENKGSWIGFYYKASNKIAHFLENTEEAVDEKIRKLRPLPVSYVAKIEKNWKPKPEQVYPIEINGAWLDTEMRPSVEILLKQAASTPRLLKCIIDTGSESGVALTENFTSTCAYKSKGYDTDHEY